MVANDSVRIAEEGQRLTGGEDLGSHTVRVTNRHQDQLGGSVFRVAQPLQPEMTLPDIDELKAGIGRYGRHRGRRPRRSPTGSTSASYATWAMDDDVRPGRDPERRSGSDRRARLRTLTAGSPRLLAHIDDSRCLGCAGCLGSCQKEALRIERRPELPHVPDDVAEFLVRSMIERGRVADLLIDGTNGRGRAFANAALGALLSLRPAERLLASEGLRSRFVKSAQKS
ncbi:MAG TPA: hypothetical protein VFD74_09650 [Thermoleophilia bacterium]|nr:hypothetical protein [Thermoleophilia bacterium]